MEPHIPAYSRHMDHEKHQMLDLNRRLQSYLSRVKLLEEENTQLGQEIHNLRHGHHGTSMRERSLKDDLHQTRAELDEVWRERVYAQMEVCKLSEEIQMLERHWQKEARAQAEVKKMMELSRKELEEEHGAHRWLKERIRQLEAEMELLIRNHEADVAQLETALSRSAPPRTTPTLDFLQLEQELSQQASRAWQETAEAYQAQLEQLEDSLRETATHLGQTERHKNEYQAQLRELERERVSEGDVRRQLEETAEEQREEHKHHINTLQEHWENLEKEKQHLVQQLELLVRENRGLLQQKMSLGLEVVTYRALLDSESLRRDDVGLLNKSRNMTLKDMPVKSLRGNYQLPARPNTLASTWRPTKTSTTSLRSKPVIVSQVHKDEETRMRVAKQESPYPKILHDGAVEEFRVQEVDEKVTYAEPLSSPCEHEHEEHPVEVEEEDGSKIIDKTEIIHCQSSTQKPKQEILEITEKTSSSPAGCKQEQPPSFPEEEKEVDGLPLQSGPPSLTKEISEYQSSTRELKSDLLGMTEQTLNSISRSDQTLSPSVLVEKNATVGFELQSETPLHTKELSQDQSSTQELTPGILGMMEETISCSVPVEEVEEKAASNSGASSLTEEITQHQSSTQKLKTELLAMTEDAFSSFASVPDEVEDEQEQTSSSGTEALLEPTLESRTSSSSSQCEFNPLDVTEIRREISYSTLGMTATDAVDMLYPDGEEMDTWDSVIEKKIHVQSSEPKPEAERQYAEPEEDISTRRSEPSQEEKKKQEDEILFPHEESPPHSDVNEEDEDSQNVSVSWRTELESDSYAQENTLADTRPLIRYTSDETDANTQVSHVDESESSDVEQDGKSGEAGGPGWSERRAKNFGTMEDLCEEVDEEVVEYDLGYSQEAFDLEKTTFKDSEEHLDEGLFANVDNVMLETDRLVEQELENLSTDSYAYHFAQKVASENQAAHPEDKVEDFEKKNMKQEVITESDIQVTHSLDLRDSMQPQRWQEVTDEKISEGMMMKEQEEVMESGVQVDSKMDLRDSVQPQVFQEVEEEKVQDGMMIKEQEVITESDVQVDSKMDLRDSAQPQVLHEVEEETFQEGMIMKEQELIQESDVQVESKLKLRDSVHPQVEQEVQDGMMMKEEVIMESDVQVECTQVLRDSIQHQLDFSVDNAKEKVEEIEVQDQIRTIEQEVLMDSDVSLEPNQDLGDLVSPQLGTVGDAEKVQDEIMTMDHEEADKCNLSSCTDTDVQVEEDLDLEELDTSDEKKEIEEKKVQDRIIKLEEAPSCTGSDVNGKSNLDLVPPRSDSLGEDSEEVMEEKGGQDGIMTMEQEEGQKVNLPSYTDNLENLIMPQFDTMDDEEKKEKEKEAQDEMMTIGQGEAQKVDSPSYMGPDVQVEGNLDLKDFLPPQLDSPDNNVEEVHDEIMEKEEAQKVYLLPCKESEAQVEPDPNLVQPQLDSPDDEEKDQGEMMTMEHKELNQVNLPSCMDPDIQAEDKLDQKYFVQPQMDSSDDDLEEVQDIMLKQGDPIEVSLPFCIDPDLQGKDNLGLRDFIQPQLDSPDNNETIDEGVKDASEDPEKREDVSMKMHAGETFSEFLCEPDLGEEDEEENLEMPKSESQNRKGLLQQYTFGMVEDAAGSLADESIVLENTSQESVVSYHNEEGGNSKGVPTFDEKPTEISAEAATAESDIFAFKDSLLEFHRTNSKGKRSIWAAHPADKWNVLENVDIKCPKDEEEPVGTQLHEEGGDGKGVPIFDEKPIEISSETALEKPVMFTVKDSFHKTNGKDQRDFWGSSLGVDAAYGSDDISTETSGIRDVEFGGELDWGKAVNGSAAKKQEHMTEVTVHSEESEVEGGPWSSGDE